MAFENVLGYVLVTVTNDLKHLILTKLLLSSPFPCEDTFLFQRKILLANMTFNLNILRFIHSVIYFHSSRDSPSSPLL